MNKKEYDFIETIAKTLWLEARGEGGNGILAVATVIYERTKHKRFPNNPVDVCLQKWQFSCWNDKTPNDVNIEIAGNPSEAQILNFCRCVAIDLFNDTFKSRGPWNHYYNPKKCNPSWADELQHKTVIGNHIFGWLEH